MFANEKNQALDTLSVYVWCVCVVCVTYQFYVFVWVLEYVFEKHVT